MSAVLADLTYGQIVRVDGRQAVVGVLRDAPAGRVPVVFTGGDRHTVLVDERTVVPVVRSWKPGTVGTCAKCGAVWAIHGDRTSHCTGCCETFNGGSLWDAHRVLGPDDKYFCAKAATMIWRGQRLKKIAESIAGLQTVGTWRGAGPDRSSFGAGS